ncbi:MAG: SLBB domain-containing protein, partial [Gammaproteobacteria bacterium]
RFDKDQINKLILPFNLNEILNNPNQESNLQLQPGDVIRIYPLNYFNTIRPVTIDGAVRAPGTFELKSGMTVKDLILEAGGVSENVYRYKLEVARVDPLIENEEIYAEIIELNMDNDYSISGQDTIEMKTSNTSNKGEFLLMPYDFISVRPDPFFKLQEKVVITGEVYYPGSYAIRGPGETLADIIIRAGGLKKNSFAIGSSFTRNGQSVQLDLNKILKRKRSRANINIQDGDEIFIALKPNIIEIIGEVNSPGLYKFVSSQRISDAIKQAGGLNPEANKKDIYIRYPNGKSAQYKRWYGNRKVIDGSKIIVGKKPEEEPFDKTEYA